MLGIGEADVLEGALWVDTGSEQLVIPLASPAAVERCRPDARRLAEYSVGSKRQGLAYVWARAGEGRVKARFFFTKFGGVVEDPGTGSACANLGGWLIAQQAPLPVALAIVQGDEVGRACRLGLRVDSERRIFVSGRVIEIGRGEISI
jgi:PhzF family phenazine biosynthesis protein